MFIVIWQRTLAKLRQKLPSPPATLGCGNSSCSDGPACSVPSMQDRASSCSHRSGAASLLPHAGLQQAWGVKTCCCVWLWVCTGVVRRGAGLSSAGGVGVSAVLPSYPSRLAVCTRHLFAKGPLCCRVDFRAQRQKRRKSLFCGLRGGFPVSPGRKLMAVRNTCC